MKRLARLLSFVAGIAALIWAMRDRFISLALPREPQPPAFRHPDDHPQVPHRPHQEHRQPGVEAVPELDDLELINGIGPVYSSKLANMGITTFSGLAAGSAAEIAGKLDTAESRVMDWIDQAKARS
jgi:predicted flap endonuclease-1-like 5' DNA nuclease